MKTNISVKGPKMRVINILNTGKQPITVDVAKDDASSLFVKHGTIRIAPGQFILVEERRVNYSVVANLSKLGFVRFKSSLLIETETETETQIVTVGFVDSESSPTGPGLGTFNVPVEVVTDDGQPLVNDVQITYDDTGGGTAIIGDDYEAIAPTELEFAAGTASGSTLNAQIEFLNPETNDTIILELSSPVNAAIGQGTHTATVIVPSD